MHTMFIGNWKVDEEYSTISIVISEGESQIPVVKVFDESFEMEIVVSDVQLEAGILFFSTLNPRTGYRVSYELIPESQSELKCILRTVEIQRLVKSLD